jgi:predicted transcriptional regulator
MPVSTSNGTLAASAKPGTYQLKKLREVHHNILRLAALGMKNNKIANVLGVTEPMVGYTIKSELGQQKLAMLRMEKDGQSMDIIAEMKELSPLAMAVLEEALTSPMAKVSEKTKAAEVILSGAGYGQQRKVDINLHHVTDDDIQKARLAARDRTIQLIEAEIEDAEVIIDDDDK